MPTKTISLELDAYEHLKRAKRSARESFSEVVRRAIFLEESASGRDLLDAAQKRHTHFSETSLDRIDQAQHLDSPPDDPWK